MDDVPFNGRVIFQTTALVELTILAQMAGSRWKALQDTDYRSNVGFHAPTVYPALLINQWIEELTQVFATS